MKVIEVVRFKDGKGVEHWAYMQPADVMKMMPPPPPPKADVKPKSKYDINAHLRPSAIGGWF